MYEDINQSMIKKIEQFNDKSEVMLSYFHCLPEYLSHPCKQS
jgi:hypothetical protein